MPIQYVSGDPLLTQAQILALGHNARGRFEENPLHSALQQKYPAAFATYTRRCQQQKIRVGELWTWREARPMLGFMVVRDSAVGTTRLRYVETVILTLARDYQREGIKSIAITPLAPAYEWEMIKAVIERWLANSALPVIVYDTQIKGVAAQENL